MNLSELIIPLPVVSKPIFSQLHPNEKKLTFAAFDVKWVMTMLRFED